MESLTLGARMFVALQRVLPQHALSRIVYRLARNRRPWLKNFLISRFVRHFKPRMDEAVEPDALRYGSFNEFFTRALKPGVRPIDHDPRSLVSPVDGTISQIGYLNGNDLIQAKGLNYALDELLGHHSEWTARFAGGAFATLYLAPYNYHRIHMPLTGMLRDAWYVPGKLFSVNAATAAAVSGLFARNERVVCVFEAGQQAFAMVSVGALFVGSIASVWHGDITPCNPRRGKRLLPITPAPLHRDKGEEMGHFNMGSTVILVFPPGMIEWLEGLEPGGRIQVGQTLARLRTPV